MNQDIGMPSGELTQADQSTDENLSNTQTSQEIHELDKLERFKFQGQEFTPQALKEAMLRQQDYTRKTQEFAETKRAFESERKAYQEEQKFESNLSADLNFISKNPEHAAKFLEVYPEKYHQALFDQLKKNQQQQSQSAQTYNQPQSHGPSEFELKASQRLQYLETQFNNQEIAKNESMIQSKMSDMSKKYPEADVEKALARINDEFMGALQKDANAKLPAEVWDRVFREVEAQEQLKWKTKYSTMVKGQAEKNDKFKDTGTGGASVGRAPTTFTKLSDVTKYAAKALSQQR